MAEIESVGRITIEDVRKTLDSGAIDPRKTNAGAVRAILGRGSLGTIQKYLEILRAELAPPAPALAGAIPAAPVALAEALWHAAWTAAQASTAQALAKALLERDEARNALATTADDLGALAFDADAAMQVASDAQDAAKTAQEALSALKSAAEAKSTLDAENAATAAEIAAAALAAVIAKHALDRAHAETQHATMQGTIDRLIEQLAEVKSLLPRHAASTQN